MNRSPSLWRRLWFSLPLAYKLVIFGLGVVISATLAVLVVTYMSAGDSLKLQLERQVSRDLNVFEAWYRTRFEDMQLTSINLVRRNELHDAIATGRFADAAPLLTAEVRRLHVDFALLVDRRMRVVGLVAGGRDEPTPQTPLRFDPSGLVSTALTRNEPIIGTEAWRPAIGTPWPSGLDRNALVRVVATPIGSPPTGVLVLGERLGTNSSLPGQITAMIGGSLAILDNEQVLASSGFPHERAPSFTPQTWAWVGQGRDFFEERRMGGQDYVLAFRPIVDHQDRPVGAVVRGFSESLIGETLSRYAGDISLLATAAILASLLTFFWLTRRLLFPLHRLAAISASLAAGDLVPVTPRTRANDELGRLEKGVASLADRLVQSREELAEAAVKLEAEAARLAERNAQLAELNHENARLLDVLRDHDRLRGQLIEKIITAQEDERKRIARELHDETGQSLTGLLVGLKTLEGARSVDEMRARTADLKQLTVATLEEVHKLSVALRPAMLDDLGLVVAVRSLVKDFGAKHGLTARFQAEAIDRRLPPLWEVTLYRVVQEALTNVAKYAQAREVVVSFAIEGDRFSASVQDDGVGFEPRRLPADGREPLGLLGMQERVSLIGGEFRLDSSPGRGTRIVVSAPLPGVPLRLEGSLS